MNRVDGVILGVGVVVLAASIVGVFLYDDTAGNAFEVSFQESDATELSELTEEGVAAGEYPFEQNITDVRGLANSIFAVEVTRNGAVITADSVEVTLEGPDGESGDCSFEMAAGASGSGTCDAEATVSEQPDPVSITAENASEAEQMAEAQLTAAGSGEWVATVTITAGQGAPGPGEPSYSITVTPQYTTWDARATAPGPDIGGP